MRRAALGAVLAAIVAGAAHAAVPADGLYLMTRFAFNHLETGAYYFKGGQVAHDVRGGLEAFDFATARAQAPGSVGTVRQAGDKMIVDWGDGKVTESRFEPDTGGCFGWDAGSFCPVGKFPADAKLDARFSGGASVGGGAVSSTVTLTLGRDGRYAIDRMGAVSTAVASGGSSSAETGTYRLGGNTLTLQGSNGATHQVLVFPYDDGSKGPQPRRLYFDGAMLKQE